MNQMAEEKPMLRCRSSTRTEKSPLQPAATRESVLVREDEGGIRERDEAEEVECQTNHDKCSFNTTRWNANSKGNNTLKFKNIYAYAHLEIVQEVQLNLSVTVFQEIFGFENANSVLLLQVYVFCVVALSGICKKQTGLLTYQLKFYL